ncbi:DEAD/DEAH box helicase [Haliangium ochraceum]|uniref:SNF2-related protein n=1 Tax=Haliangium ochraceum (strain DSM 14365 / JCM 11303 / SMP-2) TaxID=502025 RepID=D0LHF5_HALO1|nr:DEAD/DEAH box helicase [Haliangium ochraceum]ACY12817.1 SNF2-related protein [Haliangium ochraceum DSM 14365]
MLASSSPRVRRPVTDSASCVPCIRLFRESLLFDSGDGWSADYQEVDVAVIQLGFEYSGVRVRMGDPVDRVFRASGKGTSWLDRDRRAEAQAQYLLESFGAVEIGCLHDCAAPPDSAADYLVHPSGDVHALCSFSAYALPQLRSMGWRIDVDAAYPYQLVPAEAPWYAEIEPDAQTDWFELELGVEVEGRRLNLLPALLDLLDRSADIDHLGDLSRASGRCVALPTGDGRYMPLPHERLHNLVCTLLELYRGEEDRAALRFRIDAAAALEHLDDAIAPMWHGAQEVRERGRRLARRGSMETLKATPPAGLQATLRPYQEAGLAWLQSLREHDAGGVLADDMGLGKTLQTISHLVAEKEAGRLDQPALVVAPTSLVGNWMREMARFAPSLRCLAMHGSGRHALWKRVAESDVVVTTYGLLIRDLERFRERSYHLLILDEAQAIKNRRSQAHRAVKAVDARFHLCISGTPVENDLEELWSLFDVLMPDLLGSAEQFRSLFRYPIEKQRSQSRLEALRERVAPYILRRMKEDVAPELPPKTEIVRPVALTGLQRELYESIRMSAHADVRSIIRKKGLAGSAIAILDALMKLRQVCCDPRLVTVPSARRVKESAKYALFFDLLSTQREQGRRILVFSQFTSMLALLSQGLEERGVAHSVLTGATANRQRAVDEFQEGRTEVFLISLKAGGTGLNLTRADTVVHYDPWWNPAAQAQATDRAYRIGQTRPVFVYNLITAGSVEERMLALQQRKRHLADTILGQGGPSSSFDEGELDELFAPLSD